MRHTAATRHSALWIAAWLLLAGTPLFAQSAWPALRPTPIITIEIRKVIGTLMLVPAATLFLLYLFRPRPYVMAGVAAWLAGGSMLLVLSVNSGTPAGDAATQLSAGRLAIAGWALTAMAFGLALRCASTWFRAPARVPSVVTWVLAIAVGWTFVASALLQPNAVIGPAFLVMSGLQVRTAMTYLDIARRERMVGALLAGAGIGGIVLVNLAAISVAAASGGIGEASLRVELLNIVSAASLILGMHLLIFEDVIDELRDAATELSQSRDDMKAMAVTDPLTRCYNRRLLYEIADHELQQHRRYDLPLSLLYIDVDHFKAINDTLGHQTGDEVLKTLGEILRQLTRQADFVFRWGGDEFLVLLSANEADAKEKARRIRQAFVESAIIRKLPDGVDVSVGVVPVPPETTDLDPLIDQADRDMYRRKHTLGS